MSTFKHLNEAAQRAICLFFAVLIVSSSLALGAVTSQAAFEHSYAAHAARK